MATDPALEALKARLAWIRARRDSDIAGAADTAAMEAALSRYTERIERWEADVDDYMSRSTMPTRHDTAYTAATAALNEGLGAALAEIKKLDSDLADERILPGFYERERARVLAEVRVADGAASDALRAYTDGALADARALRAKAEAGRDPATRMADELERARLAQSPLDAEHFLVEAQSFLAAGQPERASFLLGIARDKGARLTGSLEQSINAALDESIPERSQANAIEAAVASNATSFAIARLKALSETLGVTEDGSVGTGSVSDRASANVAATMGEHVVGSRS